MTANPTPLTPEEIKALVADATPAPCKAEKEVNMSGGETGRHWIVMLAMPMAYDFDRAEDAQLAAAAPTLAHTALSAIAERDALRAGLEAALSGEFQNEKTGAAATRYLHEMYPHAFQSLGHSGRRSLRNFIDQHVESSLLVASRAALDAGETEEG